MSKTVENQVVAMQFDNKHFESNVKTSLGTLDKLKKSLKLQDAAKGFENVSAAAKKVNLNPLGNACQTVGLRFNALYTMADQAMRNITNSVQRAATNIVKSFTLDPIKTGFQEYETQINAVQTILANTQSKGTTLNDVNAALDTLNTYADKTIYNFTEMTRNIGTFTAAGVDLDTSVSAIQGIANLAAVSGSNAQQASTAMYQLSQALASGTVKLMDWNSVVNAGMGGQVFQDALKETARVHGIEIDKMIKDQGSFRETLQKGWLTSEILTETLWKFTLATDNMTESEIKAAKAKLKQLKYTDEQIEGIFQLGQTATDAATKVKTFTQMMDTLKESAQSGWTQTWELLIGDFEEAKNLWTTVSDVFSEFIGKSAESRNKLLSGALDNSGWDKFVGKVKEAGVEVSDFEDAVKEAAKKHNLDVDAMIKEYGSLEKAVQKGKISIDILKEAMGKFFGKKGQKDFEEYTVKAGDTLSELAEKWNTSVEEIALLNNIKDINKINVDQILKIPKAIAKTKGDIEDFADVLEHVQELGGKELLHESVANAWKGLTTILREVGKAWRDAFPPMQSDQLFGIIKGIHEFSTHLVVSEDTAEKLGRTLKGIFAILDIVTTLIGGGFKFAFKTLTSILGKFDLNILDITAGLGDAIVKVRDNLDKGIDAIANFAVAIYKLPQVQNVLTKVKSAFSTAFAWIVDLVGKLKSALSDLFGGGQISSEASKTIESITEPTKTLAETFGKFKKLASAGSISDIGYSDIKNFTSSASEMADVISGKLTNAGIDLDTIKERIAGFFNTIRTALDGKMGSVLSIATLIGFFLGFKKIFNTVSDSFTAFTDVIKSFSKGFVGISQSISKFMNTLGDTVAGVGKSIRSNLRAQTIKTIAVSLAILVASLIALSYVPVEQLKPALVVLAGVAALLATLSIVMTKFVDEKDLAQMSGLMLAFSGSLIMIAYAAKILGEMDESTFNQGVVAIMGLVGAIAILTAVSKFAGKDMWSLGQMLIKIGGSLLLMSLAIGILGKMEAGTLTQGIKAVTILLGEIALMMFATKLLAKNNPRAIENVGRMMKSFGVALLLLSASVAIFGNMDTATIIKGIASISVLLLEMVGLMAATKLLAKADKGQSFVKIGGILASFGAALLLMSAAIAILGNMKLETLVQGGLAVTAFMGIMLVVMSMSKKLVTDGGTAAKAGLVMLEFAGAMVLLTGVILILGMIKTETLLKAVGAIAAIGLVFAAMIKATSGMTKQIGMIVALAAAVGVLAIALAALTLIDDTDLLKTAGALSAVMAMMAVLTASTKFASLKGVATVAILALVVAGLAYIIKDLSDINADQALGVAKALSLLIVSLSASAALLGTIGLIGPAALIGVGVLAVLLLTLAGFAALALWQLPNIAKQLSSFMTELDPFISGMEKMTGTGILDGVKILAEAIALLTAAALGHVLGNAAGGIDTAFDKFLSWIKELMPVIKEFAIELGGDDININTDNLNAVMGAVKTLAEIANLAPRDKSYAWGAYVETTNLTEFTDWIKEVMPVITAEALKLSKEDIAINSENLNAVTGAVKTLAEAAALAPTEESLSVDLPTVGASYVSAVMLGEFSKWVTDVFEKIGDKAVELSNLKDAKTGKKFNIDGDAVKAVADAGASLAKAASGLDPIVNKTGVFGNTYTETDNLTAFTDFISGVFTAISGEAQVLSSLTNEKGKSIKIDKDAVKAVAEAGEALIKAASGLDPIVNKTGVFGDTYAETDNLTAFSDFITGVYSAISTEAQTLSNLTNEKGKSFKIDKDAVEAVAKAGEALVSAASGLDPLVNKTGVFGNTYAETDNLTAFADFVSGVYTAISGEAQALSNLTNEKGKSFKIDKDAVEAVAKAGEALITAASSIDYATVSKSGVFGNTYTETENLTAFTNFISGVYSAISTEAQNLSSITTEEGKSIKIDKDAITAVGTAAESLISAASGLDSSLVTKTGVFGDTYTETDNLTAFTNFIAGVYTAISTEAQNLANLTDADGSLAKIDAVGIKAVADAGAALASAASGLNPIVNKTGVFGDTYTETENLGEFQEFVTGVFTAISGQAAELAKVTDAEGNAAKIDGEAIKAIATAGVELANAAAAVPKATENALKIGDLEFTSIQGSDITGFTEWLTQILPAIQKFSVDVSGDTIKPEAVTAVANAGLILAEMANTITGDGLWDKLVSHFTGDTKWSDFATGLSGFADAMVGFSTKLIEGNINGDAVQAAANAGLMLSQAFLALDSIGYYLSDDTIAQFESFLGKFGLALQQFSTDVTDIDDASITAASGAVSGIASAMATLKSFPYGEVDVEAFKAKCTELATAITEFSTDAGNIDPSGAIANITSLVGMLTTISAAEFSGASQFKTALAEVASTSIADFTNKFSDEAALNAAKSAGSNLMAGVAEGITSNASAIETAADGAVVAGSSAIGSITNYTSYYTAGEYVGGGFVAGISSMLGEAAAAGTSLGNAALEAAKAALKEHSPSKAFYEVGEFAGMGLVNALYEYERTTYKAGYGVGESANSGLSDAISKVRRLIENGVGEQPTIRPVMDLSDVSAGIDGMNRMFNMNPSVGVSAKVGNIGALVDQVQNGGNSDVIAAINKLGGKISESGRDTYNINGVTYDDGSNITETVKSLVRAVLIEGRV